MIRAAVALASVALAAASFEDILKYETFVPKLVSERFGSPMDKYATDVEVRIEYSGDAYFLDLTVDKTLFAPDWFLETTDENGVTTRTTNTSNFMCHYTGVIKGVEDSRVVMSLCDQLGMSGTVFAPNLAIEVQHFQPLNMLNGASHSFRRYHGEAHIVYRLDDVVVDGIVDHILHPDDENLPVSVGDDPRPFANAACITASDSTRMNAFSSGNAEAQNTQAVMAQSNNRYSATSWTGGSQLTHSIGGQVQNPSGWTRSTNMNQYLQNLSTYKRNSHSSRDNVVGLTHTSFGGTIGLAWLNTMCQAANSCGLNNVGWSSSNSARGVLVAHEIGHNFAFAHDANPQTGFVMWPSIITGASRFSQTSVNRFAQVRGNFRCL